MAQPTADVLTREERVRLEALAQAVAHHAMSPSRQPETVVATAKTFESYITKADNESS